jgi:hypothetical protein
LYEMNKATWWLTVEKHYLFMRIQMNFKEEIQVPEIRFNQ